MSLWEKTQKLPQESSQKVYSLYGDHFPIEVRHFLAAWIEKTVWMNIQPNEAEFQAYISNLAVSFIEQLESTAASMQRQELFPSRIKLMETAKVFRQKYLQNPGELYRVISHCLSTEMYLVQQAGNVVEAPMPPRIDAPTEIAQELKILRQQTQKADVDLRNIQQEQSSLSLIDHERSKLMTYIQQLTAQPQTSQNVDAMEELHGQKNRQDQLFNAKAPALTQLVINFERMLHGRIARLSTLLSRVLDGELVRWKREQQLARNGVKFSNTLEAIQKWCEGLAELIWLNRQQIKEAQQLKGNLLWHCSDADILPALDVQITQLLSSLITSTFIVVEQPPQVLKTNLRFISIVRLLVGGKLNVHMTPPQVKVSIISENQANALLTSGKIVKNSDTSGEILNNSGTMEYKQATGHLSLKFCNMQLKKIKRPEKKGIESVMDEKFALLFQSQFSVGGGELVFQVWTLSLPLVVIVHGNQEPQAWATITWDNAFAEAGRVPFVVPRKAPWSQIAETLNAKFKSATERPLTEDHLRFLAQKVFHGAGHTGNCEDYSNLLLSWGQFCKDPLPGRKFTFWEWFYAAMKLTREHLQGLWVDGHILGFIEKKQAEEMLANCPCGTFLIRFSDSELGGVTIAWVADLNAVFMLQPFTGKDFAIRTLADRVSDLPHLVQLYPDKLKKDAFDKYYSKPPEGQQAPDNGYVKLCLVTHVPGWSTPGSASQTPSHSSVTGNSSQVQRYTPGLSQSSGVGRSSDNPGVSMSHRNLSSIDENQNVDHFNGFNYPTIDLMESYKSVYV